MKKVLKFDESRVPIKCWLDDIESGALEQAMNLSRLPFAFHHIALMPDCHQGYGMPIGGVLATEGVVVPNAVGVDIGCGMIATRTTMPVDEVESEQLKKVVGLIREVVPVGFEHQNEMQDSTWMPPNNAKELPVVQREYQNARYQLGTLGGGNHFIEIQRGSDGFVWVMIHSGSRNIGKKVADHYNYLAKVANGYYYSSVQHEWDLAFIPEHGLRSTYMEEMKYCVEFALANRALMLYRIIEIFNHVTTRTSSDLTINIAHNYAAFECHFGRNVIVHRKGATLARDGMFGIIPGSQGSKSYIVKGKGNPESFMSCSHGAGRAMGRNVARKTLNLENEIARMDSLGIIHGIRTQNDLDEAAGAYKDIDVVMQNQDDLVSIETELTPLAVIKG